MPASGSTSGFDDSSNQECYFSWFLINTVLSHIQYDLRADLMQLICFSGGTGLSSKKMSEMYKAVGVKARFKSLVDVEQGFTEDIASTEMQRHQ